MILSSSTSSTYRGRFAPSPTGLLHFGSLIAALGSFLRARHQQGEWLVRVENIDPPRELEGASESIIRSLDAHGLHWDGDIIWQSDTTPLHEQYLQRILDSHGGYRCSCARKRFRTLTNGYDGYCRTHIPPADADTSIRFHNDNAVCEFIDILLGKVQLDPQFCSEDFIIRRKDNLFAYQLAVVVDDIEQGITEIVRGNDLIETTGRQLSLYQFLGIPAPDFIHLPLVVSSDGQKLSKQNHAPAIADDLASTNLVRALEVLGQNPPENLNQETVNTIIEWAIAHWRLDQVPSQNVVI